MNLKDDEILDDVSESSNDNDDNDDDFDSGNDNDNDNENENEKNENDIDDLEEDKNDVDDDDSDNESIYNDDDNDEDNVLELSLIHKKKELNDDENDYVTDNDESDDSDDDDDFEDSDCFQKLKTSIKTNLISEYHPELMEQNESEVELMSTVVRNNDGVIIDELHRSLPFVTKYERARVIGERTRQINSGATPFIDVEPNIIDGYIIAINEFNKKKIPFIIKRPMPSGKCEYWKLSDLEIL